MPVGPGACNAKLHKAEGKTKYGADGEACTRQKENEPTCQTKCGKAYEFEWRDFKFFSPIYFVEDLYSQWCFV